ncbi:hypothetical protein L1887_50191 [Cichorium endivia]|nr:hypothetical protein L1887_50191 [Cichorium endivia]
MDAAERKAVDAGTGKKFRARAAGACTKKQQQQRRRRGQTETRAGRWMADMKEGAIRCTANRASVTHSVSLLRHRQLIRAPLEMHRPSDSSTQRHLALQTRTGQDALT